MVDVHGIDNHQITNIPIVTTGGVVKIQHGPVLTILQDKERPFALLANLNGTRMM